MVMDMTWSCWLSICSDYVIDKPQELLYHLHPALMLLAPMSFAGHHVNPGSSRPGEAFILRR
jgi:hypothetical protein